MAPPKTSVLIATSLLLGTIELNMGYTYRQEGALDQAEEAYNRARLQFEAAAELVGQAQAQVELNLAVLEQSRGNMELARQHLNASEAYLRSVDRETARVPPRRQAGILAFQADIHDSYGESAEAEDRYKEALAIYAKHPDPLPEADTLVNYAGLLARLNRGEEARAVLARSRDCRVLFHWHLLTVSSRPLSPGKDSRKPRVRHRQLVTQGERAAFVKFSPHQLLSLRDGQGLHCMTE